MLALPLISVALLNFCIEVISIMFVGHLGQLRLSAASVATYFTSIIGINVLVGMASALDTLCGQSYGAMQHLFKVGIGSSGAAIANSISFWMNVLILTLYVKFSPSCVKTWAGFSKEALHNIPSFLRLAIPSPFMVW
ncbi:hypothetical protein RJT34_12129 [Clitoria ternatea]|uniref:MATE efflux family protein n=1 Tax=Clitoria ternatea TaxID=43366 RepID=A0AAN9JLL0_CLITE